MCVKEIAAHALSLCSLHEEEIMLEQIPHCASECLMPRAPMATVSALPACDHACLESAEPMGLRCGGVRGLKGSPSRDSFACLEMRKTRLC